MECIIQNARNELESQRGGEEESKKRGGPSPWRRQRALGILRRWEGETSVEPRRDEERSCKALNEEKE